MGIHGLTSFIDKNPHVLHPFELKNCSVVIDGNNFYHYLYYACHVNCCLGGDYDIYRKKLISTFKAFEKCGICPYVVLDGGYPVDDRKLKTSLMRATMRNTLVSVMARFGRGQVLPILAYDTFMQVMSELGVHHVTCQFEADREIAVLANRLKCPVISNDSDFYIFDLIGGFLPLDYIDFRPLCKSESLDSKDAAWYLHAHVYHVDDFISAFPGLSRQALPVFACLLGNDFIKASAFDSFYSRLQVPKVYSKKFQLSPRLSKIIGVLHWFHTHNKDWSNLLQEVVQFLKPQNQSSLRKLFLTSLNVYSNIDDFEACDLNAFFDEGSGDFNPVAGPGFSGYNGTSFPEWFLNSVCKGDITPSTINAAVLHRIIFLSQVEDLSLVTSYKCSEGIRRVLYGILLKSDSVIKEKLCNENCASETFSLNEYISASMKKKGTHGETVDDDGTIETFESSTEDDEREETDITEEELEAAVACLIPKGSQSKSVMKETHMEEYHRVRRHIQRSYIDPSLSIEGSSLPTLSSLQDSPVESRQHVLLSALDVNKTFFGRFSDDIFLYSSCISAWLKNADPKVSEIHLDCVILCLMYLSIHNKLSCKLYKRTEESEAMDEEKGNDPSEDGSSKERPSKIDLFLTLRAVAGDQLQKVLQNLSKYHKNVPTFNHKNHMQPSIIHAFAQLQACMLEASNLNKLLRFPVPNLRPAFLHNGTFLYNVFEDLISRPKPDLFMGTLLISDSPVHKFFMDFKSVLLEFLPENVFADAPQGHLKKSRKRLSKDKSGSSSKHCQDDDPAKSSDNDEEKEFTAISGFDVSNKFSSLLSLDG